MPVSGAPHVAYKPDAITREEVNARLNASLADMAEPGVRIGGPHLIRSSQEMALTIAAPVMGGVESTEVIAAVVAVISFQEVFASVQQPVPLTERKSTRLNSSHANISYAVFCLKKKKIY